MLVDVGLGIVFVAGIGFTAYMLMDSWGGASWVLTSVVSVVVCALALSREKQKALFAGAGVAVTAFAVAASLLAGDSLPQEPAPITALAMAVLVGSALRTLPIGAAAGIALGGVAVVFGAWLDGRAAVTFLATAALAVALVLGPVMRAIDHTSRISRPHDGDSVI
ncbi:metal transporter [Amycolatopsis azurea DSM 43854]|uniref:Metal transporter n=2 Tax=Amycolatopsis azurea TaxID=36819 RepID=M2QII5_9PSEU|nr:Two-component system sensor kinase [Amycolatopsis azurea DSM 43854]OOC05631.1 metal transporter [Amycolatopsis azurea DSM 43854]